ncbi:MAG: maleylpyruvate isomerase N-terminal domain-containing protein [Actinomycetota bacterium]
MDRREELLNREAESWQAFVSEVEGVPVDRRSVEGVVPGWSVKDLVHHCGGWARFSGDQLEARASGTFRDPFEGVPDEHWDRVSQEMIDESRRMSFEDVLRDAEDARARARSIWSTLPTVTDDAARFFSDETAEHYDEHRVEIRAFRERG